MINKDEQERIINKALTLNDKQRAQFITQINDIDLREHIEGIINEQQNITQFFEQNNTDVDEGNHSNELKTGSKIHRITIEKLLGEGGMGSVYQGYDEKLKRKVAIKSIRSEYLKVESTHERFIREAQILSKINHPSICHIYDYIETENRDYLVLELIQGKQLNQAFLDYDALLKVLLELAKALEAAHKHGIVHRDLKPDNIMLTDDNHIKVLDFGIAQSLTKPIKPKTTVDDSNQSGMTKQGSIVGTIRYMSPEQASGETISTASDIYSLGIIIQELFSHEDAYASNETEELLESVQKGQTVEFNSTYKKIKPLVLKLCQLSPEKRPNATEVCLEIKQLILAPKIRKRRIIQFVSSLFFIALIIFLSVQWQQSQFQSNSAELAKSYTNNINQLVRESEQIYVLPLHNTQPGIQHILQKGTELYIQIENDPLLTERDKLQLQGIIFLESEDYQSAVEFLEKSKADDGLLARAWIGLYIDKTSEYAAKYGISKALEAIELRQNYLDPAIYYIDKSAKKDPIHQAFKTSLTESLEAGLYLLDKVIQAQSWDKRAIKLKTQLLLTQAEAALQKGDWQRAKNLYEQTSQTYEHAINMARSYPDTYLGLCQVNNVMLFDNIQRTGEHYGSYANKAIQACKDYLTAYPNDDFAINLLARIHLIVAQGQINENLNPSESLDKAQYWINETKDNNNSITIWTKALFHNVKATDALKQGLLIEDEINQAINQYKKVISFNPIENYPKNDLINAYGLLAELRVRKDQDITEVMDQADLLSHQLLQNPLLSAHDKRTLYLNMGALKYIQLINKDLKGKDIIKNGDELLDFYQSAMTELPDEPNLLISHANVSLWLAQSSIDSHDQSAQYLEFAETSFQKAQSLNNEHPMLKITQLWLESLKSYTNNSGFLEVEKQFKNANKDLNNNAQFYYLWANHYFLNMQKTADTTEQNKKKQKALIKINQALDQDSTNKLYLHLKLKIDSVST